MSEELIVRQCAPTLAGMKTGSMFSYRYSEKKKVLKEIREFNHCHTPKGLRMVPLKISDGFALIYLYRPVNLERDLQQNEARRLLCDYGYEAENMHVCICQLSRRMTENKKFPHEVGLFLGYPPEDVIGFIENKAASSKCVGCWRVYGDEQKAKETFEKYKRCTRAYYSQWAKGKSIKQLIVADSYR